MEGFKWTKRLKKMHYYQQILTDIEEQINAFKQVIALNESQLDNKDFAQYTKSRAEILTVKKKQQNLSIKADLILSIIDILKTSNTLPEKKTAIITYI